MSIRLIVFLVVVLGLIILYIIALRKKWIGSAGSIYTSQVMMHDLANQNRQKAMEYVMENHERTIKEEDESGEGPEGGKYNHESNNKN